MNNEVHDSSTLAVLSRFVSNSNIYFNSNVFTYNVSIKITAASNASVKYVLSILTSGYALFIQHQESDVTSYSSEKKIMRPIWKGIWKF